MIIVATHKEFDTSILNEIYTPFRVGAINNDSDFGYCRDDFGDNISKKNPNYCELTALYSAYKNYAGSSSYLGLVHYRRFFVRNSVLSFFNFKTSILTDIDIETLLDSYDVILPRKRRYPFVTAKRHYQKNHNSNDLKLMESVLSDKYPEYIESYNSVMNRSSLHLYNMFIMNTNNAVAYCNWLFDILFELERKVDISDYDAYQSRIFGFLSERLLNVWVHHNSLKVKSLDVYEPDGRRYFEKAKKFILNL